MVFANRRCVRLASVVAVALVCASAGTLLLAKQAKKGEPVMIILTTVKAGRQQQFEDYLAKFRAAYEKVSQTDSATKKAADHVRFLYPSKANDDATFSYVFLVDPVLPEPHDYLMEEILKKVLPQAEVDKLMMQFEEAIIEQQILELVEK